MIDLDITQVGFDYDEREKLIPESKIWHSNLISGRSDYIGSEFTGWVNWPETVDEDLLEDIIKTAEDIKSKCTLLIVIGVGGSYLGAEAVINALGGKKDGWPEVTFAGYNMCASHLKNVIELVGTEETCICVISKSGRTVEPLISYSIIKERLIDKYGVEEAKKRTFVITDLEEGDLRPEVIRDGLKSFEIPGDVGGRYSVLTPVGLLPIAACGHDIKMLISGARRLKNDNRWQGGELLDYAITRVALQSCGKYVEIFELFECRLRHFGEWLKQLFAESEGKDGKGAYPASLHFSRDLHSIGQFLQQGRSIFFETIISLKKPVVDIDIPISAGETYGGKTLEYVNSCCKQGVISAHREAGIPLSVITIDELNENTLGEMIYFFEMSAAISSYLLGVNPFNQPGVEKYKEEMKKLINNV